MITYNDAPQSVGLLWTNDQSVAEASTWQHTTLTTQTSMPWMGFEPTISAGERPKTYALDRTATGTGHNVRYGEHYSKYHVLQTGLPQGAVPSWTLFNLYINDLIGELNSIPDIKWLLYADDLVFWTETDKRKAKENTKQTLNKALAIFEDWCERNNMKINTSKPVCGNKMPTRCNWGFYCRSYCLLNMFRASPCPSSGAQEYYTVVAACGILFCGFSSSWSGVELRVMRPVCRILQTGRIILLSSWWWAWWCPKHVEQAIRSTIKTSVASSWHFVSTYGYRDLQSSVDVTFSEFHDYLREWAQT